MIDLLNLKTSLLNSNNPSIRYKTLKKLCEDVPEELLDLERNAIAEYKIARSLINEMDLKSHPYDGIRTCSWILKFLAEIDYPPGDDSLHQARDNTYKWITDYDTEIKEKLLIKDKYRMHGSFHGNALFSTVTLGLENSLTDQICENLLQYQWPGGGWNCKKLPKAKGPDVVHTCFGMRGLITYNRKYNNPEVKQAIENCAEILLDRQVFLSRRTGEILSSRYKFLYFPYPHYYNFMIGLLNLTEAGYIQDSRCQRALDLLESKFIPGEGWPMEKKDFHHSKVRKGYKAGNSYTSVYWENEKIGKANLFLTVDALYILKKAGRIS